MVATIAAPAPPLATAPGPLALSRYICDANVRFAAALEITFRWLAAEPLTELELPPGAAEVFDRFILALRSRATRKSALEITFTQEPRRATLSARYVINSTLAASAADPALFDVSLFDHGQDLLKKKFSLNVESFAYWEEAKLTLLP